MILFHSDLHNCSPGKHYNTPQYGTGMEKLSIVEVELDDTLPNGRRTDTSYLSDIERSHVPDPIHDPSLLPIDSVEDHFLMDTGSYDEDSSAAVQLQSRAMRSPRRCIPHQQSCLGYPLPCCDPCDTCYCRFFNAICYCRRVGHACPLRRT
ncbi:Agouti-related protein Precursor [Channa argus]|uniref:Agouti-related protein n=1 Tax=Channa argus TaxID=215402 RepID=A0A6G1P7G4_CHAAH|nr:Agouti-related protein Precursor [Channa argus]